MSAVARFFPAYGKFHEQAEERDYSSVQEAVMAMPAEMKEAFEYHRENCHFLYNYNKGILSYYAMHIGEWRIEDLGD